MRNFLFLFLFFNTLYSYASYNFCKIISDSALTPINELSINKTSTSFSIYEERLRILDSKTPMNLVYNSKVKIYIDSYLSKNKALISRMKGIDHLYFPLFEQMLDKYDLPLEFKYLAIVESALKPKAKSPSGAVGLWQFMYLTGKQYGLNVNSFIDERQDPIKSTEAACKYFKYLYEIFGDWNLVLAAYNGGPGYLQRKINSIGTYDFWQLYPYLRKETRNYIPNFIAVNYAMNFANEHGIETIKSKIEYELTDTLTIKKQVDLKVLSEVLCVNKQTINHLNPSYKKNIFPKGSVLILPSFAVNDFLDNEVSNYNFIVAVENKEFLIEEERIVYIVRKGDYLGKIARDFGVHIFEIKNWNNLKSTNLDIDDKLIIYSPKDQKLNKENIEKIEYIVKKGDTLWGIAEKYDGLSIWQIKSLNNLESDTLKPGTKIFLPVI